MIGLLCRVIGHQRTLVAFTSNRYSCRRCGADLGRDIPAMPSPSTASHHHPSRSPSDRSTAPPRERSRHPRLNTRGTERLRAHPPCGGA